jgi:hypothetical protein
MSNIGRAPSEWICLFLAGVSQEKDIRLMAAPEERKEALSIPEAR